MVVEPIKNIEDINRLKEQILKDCSYKECFYFILGINTGIMSAQARPLKWADVKKNHKKTYIIIKTMSNKNRHVYLNSNCTQGLKRLRRLNPHDIFIFQAKNKKARAWSQTNPYKFLSRCAERIGLKIIIGTATLRKTFGYHALKSGSWSIEELSVYLSHYSPKRTKKFICWDEPEKEAQLFMPKIG